MNYKDEEGQARRYVLSDFPPVSVDEFSQRLGKFQSCILVVLGGLLNVFQIYVLAKNA